jgi:hypothetical protein
MGLSWELAEMRVWNATQCLVYDMLPVISFKWLWSLTYRMQ